MSDMLDLLGDLIAKARRAGADAADAVYVEGDSLSIAVRLGDTEKLERAEGRDLGLRVFVGRRQANVSSSDVSPEALDELVARAVAMAREVPEDPFCGIADPDQLATDCPDLDACDSFEPEAEALLDWAREAEDAARAVPGVTNSEGAEASWGRSRVFLAASNGFARWREGSRFGLSASVLAGEGTGMERDYDYSSSVHAEDLRRPADIGRGAGEKAVRRLGPRKVATAQVPVIFDPRVAGSLVGHLAMAVNGTSIARGTSFLKNALGQQVFGEAITIVDDPLRPRGLRSKPFDGEGLPTARRNIVENGLLTTWILDLRSARQLGLASTGHAARGTGGPPSPSVSNLYLEKGSASPADLMADVKQGLYVTEMIGFGVNAVTGDYSRGAAGFWIEDGRIAYPVSELTVAGRLQDMFRHLSAADDLVFRFGTDAPTLRVDGMTVAGQ